MTLDGTQAQVYGPSPEFFVGIIVSNQMVVWKSLDFYSSYPSVIMAGNRKLGFNGKIIYKWWIFQLAMFDYQTIIILICYSNTITNHPCLMVLKFIPPKKNVKWCMVYQVALLPDVFNIWHPVTWLEKTWFLSGCDGPRALWDIGPCDWAKMDDGTRVFGNPIPAIQKYIKYITGWWFGIWMSFFPSYWEFHHPNWRTHIFHRGIETTNQLNTWWF